MAPPTRRDERPAPADAGGKFHGPAIDTPSGAARSEAIPAMDANYNGPPAEMPATALTLIPTVCTDIDPGLVRRRLEELLARLRQDRAAGATTGSTCHIVRAAGAATDDGGACTLVSGGSQAGPAERNPPDWAAIRSAYEDTSEPVAAIAERHGFSRGHVHRRATAEGWRPRQASSGARARVRGRRSGTTARADPPGVASQLTDNVRPDSAAAVHTDIGSSSPRAPNNGSSYGPVGTTPETPASAAVRNAPVPLEKGEHNHALATSDPTRPDTSPAGDAVDGLLGLLAALGHPPDFLDPSLLHDPNALLERLQMAVAYLVLGIEVRTLAAIKGSGDTSDRDARTVQTLTKTIETMRAMAAAAGATDRQVSEADLDGLRTEIARRLDRLREAG